VSLNLIHPKEWGESIREERIGDIFRIHPEIGIFGIHLELISVQSGELELLSVFIWNSYPR
jgi:hypothetical protein